MLRKLGNICCGHKMFPAEQNQKHFLCPGHKICVSNKCCVRGQEGKHLCRQQCVLVCQSLDRHDRMQFCKPVQCCEKLFFEIFKRNSIWDPRMCRLSRIIIHSAIIAIDIFARILMASFYAQICFLKSGYCCRVSCRLRSVGCFPEILNEIRQSDWCETGKLKLITCKLNYNKWI